MIEEKKIDLRTDIFPFAREEARAFLKTLSTPEIMMEFYRLKDNLEWSMIGLSFVILEMKERIEEKEVK